MTPKLASARKAIQAELSHARKGVAFYSARVEALENALGQLENVEARKGGAQEKGARKTGAGMTSQESGRGRKARAAKGRSGGRVATGNGAAGTARRGRTRKARSPGPAEEAEKLPTTGTDFWLQLVTDEPKSAVEIANAAAEAIGLQPDQKDQLHKLKQRVAPALATLVSHQKIQDSGEGRQRRFFKGEMPAA